MQNKPEYCEDEINLRDYINVLIKRKVTILVVFFVCVIFAAIYSFKAQKVYQSSVSIMITPSKIQRTLSPGEISLNEVSGKEGKIELKSIISLPTHKELLKSNTVLKRVIDKLDITDSEGEKIHPVVLASKLDIKRAEETNILQLLVKDKDPELSRDIANTWANEYIDYTQEIISGEVKSTEEFITSQFKIAEQNLIQAEEKVKNFKDKHKLDLMQAELDMKKSKLNNAKKEFIDLAFNLKVKQDLLNQLKEEVKQQDKYILQSKAITDNALWENVIRNKGMGGGIENKRLTSEVINPIYQNLEKRIVNTRLEINTLKPKTQYLENSISQTKDEIDKLGSIISQKQLELTRLNRRVNIYKKTYNNLSNKIEEARIIKAAQLDEVKIISEAIASNSPISLKKKQNIAIAAVLGLMLGVFIAFFREFWANSEGGENKEQKE